MAVVPEKREFHKNVYQSLSSQFWGGSSQSTRSAPGLCATTPCEPSPLPLCTPTGLSRTQFLVMAHSLKLPAVPAYNGQQGGWVFDRVLARTGGKHWWMAFIGRVKAGKLKSHPHQFRKLLRDGGTYTLTADSRFHIGRDTHFKVSCELCPGSCVDPACTSNLSTISNTSNLQPLSTSFELKRKLTGKELKINATANQTALDSKAGYVNIPYTTSVDVSNANEDKHGLQYRLGLCQITTRQSQQHHTPDAQASSPMNGEATGSSTARSKHGKHQMRLFAQAAIAAQGCKTLWQAPHFYDAAAQATADSPSPSAPDQPPHHTPQGPSTPAQRTQAGRSTKAAQPPASMPNKAGGTASTTRTSPVSCKPGGAGGRSLAAPSTPLPRNVGVHVGVTTPFSLDESEGEEEDMLASDELVSPVEPPSHTPLISMDAAQIQSALTEQRYTLDQLRQCVAEVRQDVQGGCLTAARVAETQKAKKGQRQLPWSSFVGSPHFKVAGLVGGLLRTHGLPVPQTGPGAGAHSAAAQAAGPNGDSSSVARPAPARQLQWLQQHLQQPLSNMSGGLFLTGAASLQLGRFQRAMFDFTRVITRYDMVLKQPARLASWDRPTAALPPPSTTGDGPEQEEQLLGGVERWQSLGQDCLRGDSALMETACARHSLSVSLRQQLIGPVRACADIRFTLDSPTALGALPWRSPGSAAAQLAAHMKELTPHTVDAVYGVDVALPYTRGAARAVLWWAPGRKEGTLALRLL